MSSSVRTLTCRAGTDAETKILVGAGVRTQLATEVLALGPGRRVFALADRAAADLHPTLVPEAWPRLLLPGGEECKSFVSLEQVLRALARAGLDRQSILVTIGGGSIGDLGGLAASLFLRGIDLVQVPTTLLAMLDSSIGGKTALNLPEGKNLVGTFWPPRVMLADVELARSLPADQLRSGLAEALKMGIGFSRELFDILAAERHRILAGEAEVLAQVVTLAITHKIAAVEADPTEQNGRRRCLNLGHTLGHALEAHSDYTVLHGLAVARGLHHAVEVSRRRQLLTDDDATRCVELLRSYGFEPSPLPPAEKLRPYLARDKKMQDGRLHMVLVTGVGACKAVPMKLEEVL